MQNDQELIDGLDPIYGATPEKSAMTNPLEALVAEIEAGLEGVTKGEWYEGDRWVFVPPIEPERNQTKALRHIFRDVPDEEVQANCRHVARCSPNNIRAILEDRRSLQGEVERLTKERDAWFQAAKDAQATGSILPANFDSLFVQSLIDSSEATSLPGAVVKELVWQKAALFAKNDQLIVRVADTVFGRYAVCAKDTVKGPLPPAWIDPAGARHEVPNIEAGQAAAQDHFDRAILSSIELKPVAGAVTEAVICDVLTLQHSSGFPDHFTRIRKGDRSLTMFMSKVKGRCEYHAAELDWLLNGAEKPNILAFDYTEPQGLSALSQLPAGKGEAVRLTYTNWRGETAEREIIPKRLWFGSTEWHPEPQWLITAVDTGKGQERDFALSGFTTPQAPVDENDRKRLRAEELIADLDARGLKTLGDIAKAQAPVAHVEGEDETCAKLLRIHSAIKSSNSTLFVHPPHPESWSSWAETILDAAIALDGKEGVRE